MKSIRRIVLGGGGLAVIGILALSWSLSWGQAGGAALKPNELLPAGTVIYATADGDLAHQAAWEKTAAYEAFRKSGLLDTLSKLVTSVIEQLPDERASTMATIWEFLSEHGASVAIALPEGQGPTLPYAVIVAHDAGPHAGVLHELADSVGLGAELKTEKIGKRSVTKGLIPETPGVEIGWWAEGDHLVIAIGMNAVASAVAVADGSSPSFASTAEAKRLAAKVDFDRTAMGWVNFAAIQSRFGDIPLPGGEQTVRQVLKTIGISSVNTVWMQSGYKGRSLWSTLDIDAPGPRTGLLGLSSQSTMTLADLPPLPIENVGFFAQSLSLVQTYDEVLDLVRNLAKFGPPGSSEEVEGYLEQMPEYLGCNLRDDLLEALGPVQCAYSDLNQAIFGADYGLALQVKDAAKLRETLDKLLDHATEQLPPQFFSVVRREKHGRELITLQLGGGGFNPTLVIDDKWLGIGSSSQTAESFAMRLSGDLPSWKPNAETAQSLAFVPKQFAAVSVSYPRQTLRSLIAAAPFLIGLAETGVNQASQFGAIPPMTLPKTAIDLPPAELVVKPLFPNVSFAVVDETGLHWTTRSSAPAIPLISGADGSSVAVVAVLVALLLPAVQQAREAARRTQSKNNLKMIGLAMHNFHETFNHFPQGTIPSKTLKPEERQSWQVQLLPYMDQAPLYNALGIDLRESAPWDGDKQQPFNAKEVMVFRNPSQAEPHHAGDPAPTDYVGWAGVGKDAPTEKCANNKKGIFGYDRVTKMRDITDGTSNTVMVSDGVGKERGPWAQGGKSTIRALTTKPYVNGPDGIGSPHVGGCHVLLADGSVRFVSQNIDADTLEKLATRAGGEIVDEF